jgi:hypothetical protein
MLASSSLPRGHRMCRSPQHTGMKSPARAGAGAARWAVWARRTKGRKAAASYLPILTRHFSRLSQPAVWPSSQPCIVHQLLAIVC